jgi:hypothetical protein
MRKLSAFICLVFLCGSQLFSQSVLTPFEDWSTTTGTQNFFHKNVTVTDNNNNVYVGGATMNGSGNYDILVSKYTNKGALLWTRQVNGTANMQDFATALYASDSGSIIVTGTITDSVTYSPDMFTMKLNGTTGSITWLKTFDAGGGGYDCGAAIAISDSGAVFVTGSGMNGSFNMDVVIIKYTSTGTLSWSHLYDYGGGDDGAVKIFVDNKVHIVGAGGTGSGSYDAIAVDLVKSTGSIAATSASTGGTIDADVVNDAVRDADGNFYIAGGIPTGGSGYDIYLVKLDSNLVYQWETTYDGYSLDDIATSVKVDDANGFVYIAGYVTSSTGQKDWETIQCDTGGSIMWTDSYNDTLNGNDAAMSLELDNNNDIIVSGYDSTALDGLDYYTIKYDNTGTVIWNIRSDGNAHLDDRITNIAIDTVGDIIVTGESRKLDGSLEYKTVKYVQKNVIQPVDFAGEEPKSNFLFYKNKGQIIKTDSTAASLVKYYTNNTSPLYYAMGDTLSMVFVSTDTMGIDTLHRVNLSFTNSNNNKSVYSLNETPDLLNYYLGFLPQGITGLHGNRSLVVPNLYTNIDLIYTSNQNGLKLYFIIKPGGSASSIAMQYTGATSTNLNIGTQHLTINSIIGGTTFDQPLFYQINSSNAVIASSDGYANWNTISTDKYGFSGVTVLDATKTLIVEVDQGNAVAATAPSIANLEWCTYVGGDASDGATEITTDVTGNPYIAGVTWGSVHFPVGTTYQVYAATHPNLLGSQDQFAMKFDKTTRRIEWATYLGGSRVGSFGGSTPALDRVNDIKAYKGTDPAKEYVFTTGTTWSSDFPVVNLFGFSSSLSQDNSALLIRSTIAAFRQLDGKIDWSTCHGGTDVSISEEGTSLDIFEDGTLAVAGALTGITGHTSAPNVAYVTPSGAYTKDDGSGFFMLFDNNYQVKWFTLIGSIGGWANDVMITREQVGGGGFEKKAYIVGKAANNAYPMDLVPNPGNEYYQSTCGGGFDAYISRLNIESSYALEYSTYWGGNGTDDLVSIEGNDKVIYFAGFSQSSNLTTTELPDPGMPAYHVVTLNGSSDGVILKCDPLNQNSLDWGTLYGGNQNDAILDICFDVDKRLYCTGETRSTTGLVQTTVASYYEQSTLGNDVTSANTDGFILMFSPTTYKDLYSTYFGGKYPDGGAGIATDGTDHLFLTGATASPEATFPVVEFNTSSPLDWFDGDFSNNGTVGGYMPDTYARTYDFTYEGGVYEGNGPQSADGYIAAFKIQTSLSIGINESEPAQSGLGLYPNPVSGAFTLVANSEELEGSEISIVNMLGQVVKDNIRFSNLSATVDVSELNSGMYFIAVKSKKSYISIRFIKQ